MKKQRVGVIFGGMSTENEVSVVSANSVLKNIDREKYEVYPIYIGKDGTWYQYIESENETQLGDEINNKEEIKNVMEYLKGLDILFPVMHGLYGEDGTIQGLFKLLKKPYVGCGVLASSVGMDKVYTKIIFDRVGLKQAKYEYIKKYKNNYIYVDKAFCEETLTLDEVIEKVTTNLKFPMFIKPSNSGSSVGINKAKNKVELKQYIEYASQFDCKILIEEGIVGKEVECAVLGNEEVISSCVGEIKPAEDFYSYDAKYKNEKSRTDIPADIPQDISNEIRQQAMKAFKAIDGKGLSRVDFFVENQTHQIYINEINTLPGFTNISMYSKLLEASGITYQELISRLIELSKENP